ncbi:LCI family antimicrobial peptide [Xenorhabdus sp. TH1]|uniref:LCI family antimicrobial peptide n=1 Tax=Xenorhabdus sp. TH1 TaxID=3130166 RepID=UPI0030CE2123
MFKKLLTVGALAASIALTGGIGTALANVDIQWDNCYNSSIEYKNGLYTKYEFKRNSSVFSRAYTDKDGITWYFKGYKKLENCGQNAHVAKYEGRKY